MGEDNRAEKNVLIITSVLIAAIVLVVAGLVLNVPEFLGFNLFENQENEEPVKNIESYLNQNQIETTEEVELEEEPEEEPKEEKIEALDTSISILINDGDEETENREVELLLKAKEVYRCKLWNENEDYYTADWFDFEKEEMEMNWELTSAGGTKEVFFQCKDEEDILTPVVSDKIFYDKDYPSGSGGHSSGGSSNNDVPDSVPKYPYDLVLNLYGDTEEYTTIREIDIEFSVKNAEICEIYEEEGFGRAVLCDSQEIEDFVLSEGDELKTIYFRAKRIGGTWVEISKNIILIENEPEKPKVNLRIDDSPYITFIFGTEEEPVPATIDHYEIYRKTGNAPDETEPRKRTNTDSFVKIADVDSISYQDTNVIEGERYTYYIIAEDIIGRESPKSNYLTHDVLGDAPTVEIVSPIDRETRYGMTFVAYKINDDISKTLDVLVFLDGVKYSQGEKRVDPMLNYVALLNLDQEGSHTLKIRVTDEAGQSTYSDEIEFKWYETQEDDDNNDDNGEPAETNEGVSSRRQNTNDPSPGDVTPSPEPDNKPTETVKEMAPKVNAV
ncbi:MAG: hypothetical protein WC356_06385 [Candidatus Micrarchaeia archaeon]|jgi:hypothetical protein